MNVKWEDVKADYARKDAEIEKLKTMNVELVEALNSMSNLNAKLIRDYNGRNPPWSQMDEEHLHDSHILINKGKELNR